MRRWWERTRKEQILKTVTNNLGHKYAYILQSSVMLVQQVLPRSVCVVWGKALRGAHPAHVTGVAEEMGVQREALRARFIRELLPTLLHRDIENRRTTSELISDTAHGAKSFGSFMYFIPLKVNLISRF